MTGRIVAVLFVAVAILGAALYLLHQSDGDGQSRIAVSGAWARPGVGIGGTTAVYLEIENSGDGPDKLVGVETPAAEKAQIHVSRMDGDIVRMRRLDSLAIFEGERKVFSPGGLHVMLMGMKRDLTEGDHFPLILVFEKAGRITTEVAVQNQAATPTGHDMPHDMPHMEDTGAGAPR